MTCKIDGCEKKLFARGWCGAHYMRWRAHGDPLAGRTPNGNLRRFIFEVVLPYEGNDCILWPFGRTPKGYGQFEDGYAHRFICCQAHGEPPTPEHETAHSCGKGTSGCVTKGHVRWATHAENEADKIAHGTLAWGEKQGSAKLTTAEVLTIRSLAGTLKQREIGALFGVSQTAAGNIILRKRWALLDG